MWIKKTVTYFVIGASLLSLYFYHKSNIQEYPVPTQNTDLTNLGIIAGRGVLPKEIAEIYSNKEGNVYIAALDGEADIELIKDFPYQIFKIGAVGGVIDYFKKNQVKDIVIIGGVKRPDFSSIKVDLEGAKLIARIIKQKFLGDDKLLKTVADFLEEKGFKVIATKDILTSTIDDNRLLTSKEPSPRDLIDIEIGVKLLKVLSPFDVGQGVIVENGQVIGIEGAEGTDQLIKRCAEIRSKASGGVLVKMIKIGQDTRLDVPAIGPETITNLANSGYNGVAIEKVILIDQVNTIKLANEHKIFILQIPTDK